MKIIVQADDCGISRESIHRIISAHTLGRLDRVGLVPNGPALAETVPFLRRHPRLGISVHLNLVEGSALGSLRDTSLLTDGSGRFLHDFISLWLLHTFAVRKRRELERQVEREIGNQIQRVRELCGLQTVNVDSHRYVHLIPFVMRILLLRARDWRIAAIRLVDEPVFFGPRRRHSLRALLSLNILKVLLLKLLSRRCRGALSRAGIVAPDRFVGVLASGDMSPDVVSSSLARMGSACASDKTLVEVVVHPLRLQRTELLRWVGSRSRESFYCSAARDKEAGMLTDTSFVALIEAAEDGARPRTTAACTPSGAEPRMTGRGRPRSWVEYWDSESIFATIMKRTTDFFFERSRRLMQWSSTDVVLDIGCGPGFLEERLAGGVQELHGVDTSVRAIEQCRARFAGIRCFHFHVLDPQSFTDLSSLQGTKFTKIVCLSVVQYYQEEAELRELIENVRRVAAPEATLLIADIPVDPNPLLDTVELIKAAVSHRMILPALEFVIKSSVTRYHAVRSSVGLLAYSVSSLRHIVDSLQLDARLVRETLTFNRRRIHLLVKIHQ